MEETMSNVVSEPVLQGVLDAFMTEKERLVALCNKKTWTTHEFACLMVGIHPQEEKKLLEGTSSQITKEQFKKVKSVGKIMRRLTSYTKGTLKVPFDEFMLLGDKLGMSAWKYIKWVAENELPITRGFFQRLPFDLMELYLYFQPSNSPLRTKTRDCREFHKALYLKRAEELQKLSPKRLSNTEIWKNPQMLILVRSFNKRDGTPANYKKRTVTESWLRNQEKRPRGRPKKT
jgi:hypothetical protein